MQSAIFATCAFTVGGILVIVIMTITIFLTHRDSYSFRFPMS